MSKIQDLFVREKDGYFECVFCQTSFFTLIMFKFHLQTKHTSVTQPVELQNPSHVQAPVKNNNTKKSEKLPILHRHVQTSAIAMLQSLNMPMLEKCISAHSYFGHQSSNGQCRWICMIIQSLLYPNIKRRLKGCSWICPVKSIPLLQ